MNILLLVVVLVLLLGGVGPYWGYSSGWGYGPSIGVGGLLTVLLIVWLLGGLR
jgi:hypothetical protein